MSLTPPCSSDPAALATVAARDGALRLRELGLLPRIRLRVQGLDQRHRAAALEPAHEVGDAMLDGWWSGTIERFCREAPAPVVDITHREYAAGGAANTAVNLAALGARVRMCGLIGDDDAGRRLRGILEDAGVDTTDVVQDPRVSTTTKYRILGGDQVMLRLDDTHDGLPPAAIAALAARISDAVAGADLPRGAHRR